MNDVTERVARLRSYLAADPRNTQLACDLIDAQLSASDYKGADATIVALPLEAQGATGIRFRSARCALILGRYGEAADTLRALIADGHTSVALWHDLAYSQLCLRQTVEAAQTLADAEARFGVDAELAIVAARVGLMDGDFARAHAALDRALALAPQHATALGLRALTLLDSGEADAAMQIAEACLALHPDQHEALLVAGTVSLWRQDLVSAGRYYQSALARHPNSGRALSGYGQLLMLRNDLPAAIEQLEHAVVAMPDHIGTWHALAWAQLLEGHVDAAETSYRQAYALDDNFADSHGGLALVDALKGRTREAEQSVKRALRLNAQCVTALYAKTLLLSDSGQAEEADKLLSGLIGKMNLPATMSIRDFANNLRSRFNAGSSASGTATR
ncbi:MAG TPA: tetratricopeptide repeat protein [Xanthomonadaceae bacterium]|jgi:tetratricopeptide (TPR) repeat protein|nr:tetratricopeptide repeat protein [Xanthomonadaceae bacterium]